MVYFVYFVVQTFYNKNKTKHTELPKERPRVLLKNFSLIRTENVKEPNHPETKNICITAVTNEDAS